MSYSIVNGWTVEVCQDVTYDWRATLKTPVTTMCVQHVRDTETSYVISEVVGGGQFDFQFTADKAFLSHAEYLKLVESVLYDILVRSACMQLECYLHNGNKVQ